MTADIICRWKNFQKNFPKSILNLLKFENGMLKLHFTFLKIFQKFIVLEKVMNIKVLKNNQNQQIMQFFAILHACQDFLRKVPKIVKIGKACIV